MKTVSLDTETEVCYYEHEIPRLACMSMCVDGVKGHLIDPRMFVDFANSDYYIVGHTFAEFDMPVLFAHGDRAMRAAVLRVLEEGRLLDILHIETLLDFSDGTGGYGGRTLEALAELYESPAKKMKSDWRKRYGELIGVPYEQWPTEAREYAECDAVPPLHIWRGQQARMARQQYTCPTYALEARAAFSLRMCKAWGMRVDLEASHAVQKQCRAAVEETSPLLKSAGIVRPNGKINDGAVRDLVKSYLGDRAGRTAGGKVSADALTLSSLPPDPVVVALNTRNKASKRLSFVDKLLSDHLSYDGRCHPNYHPLGARTSRTSASGPNIQATNRDDPKWFSVRKAFASSVGGSLVRGDFATQEMRTFAQSCLDTVGMSQIASAMRADDKCDPHLILSYNSGMGKEGRQTCKSANFALLGGMGPPGLVRYFRKNDKIITTDFAKFLIHNFKNTWTESIPFFARIKQLTNQNDVSRIILARSGFARGDCFYTDACNMQFQPLAAHASKHALWRVVIACLADDSTSPLAGSRPCLFIHDEIGIDSPAPVEHAKRYISPELGRIMREAHEEITPDVPAKVEAVASLSWGEKGT